MWVEFLCVSIGCRLVDETFGATASWIWCLRYDVITTSSTLRYNIHNLLLFKHRMSENVQGFAAPTCLSHASSPSCSIYFSSPKRITDAKILLEISAYNSCHARYCFKPVQNVNPALIQTQHTPEER